MNQDWIVPVASHMLSGLNVTLWVSLLTTLLATVIGVFIGSLSASTTTWIQVAVRLYIDVFRGVPSLITLLFVPRVVNESHAEGMERHFDAVGAFSVTAGLMFISSMNSDSPSGCG